MTAPSLIRLAAVLAFSASAMTQESVAQGSVAQGSTRQVTGAVTDRHHEPLKGAVVQIENENTETVSSYVTGVDGHYIFKRLDGDADYKVWTTYRGKMSKKRFLSKFKSRPTLSINLTVRYP